MSEMSETKRIIEIGGVKVEVDLREARLVTTVRVGSKVRLLKQSDFSGPGVFSGVVVGFEPFESLPTLLVAYVEHSYSSAELKVVAINGNSKGYELIVSPEDDPLFDRDQVLAYFEREETKLNRQLEDLAAKRAYFEANFGRYWQPVVAEIEEAS